LGYDHVVLDARSVILSILKVWLPGGFVEEAQMCVRLGLATVLSTAVMLTVESAGAQPPGQDVLLTGGYRDHIVSVAGGHIDWTGGYILAEGVGYAEGVDKQQELLAERAATVIAARNALAIAKGIRLDAWAAVGDMREGLVRLEGVVKGHEVVSSHWDPAAQPPECRVEVRVPLWGVKSVASLYANSLRAQPRRRRAPRRPIPARHADVSDFVLVLDARGLDLKPCLFPCLVEDSGRVIYDVYAAEPQMAAHSALFRFVESGEPYEVMETRLRARPRGRVVFAKLQNEPGQEAERAGGPPEPTTKPATQPTTQPVPETRRRAKRRLLLKGIDVSGPGKTQLVLTQEDVDKLYESPEGVSAIRNAQVLVVVDAAAAGTEGRLWSLPQDALAAISAPTWSLPPICPSPICTRASH
jgi:hypothetical protein